MKSYTDLKQSKELAEILPLESADMYYEPAAGFCTEPSEPRFGDIKYAHPRSIRCWSLAALLDILPKGKVLIDDAHSNKYKVIGYNLDTDYYDEPLDAVFEMILKLHEKNLL